MYGYYYNGEIYGVWDTYDDAQYAAAFSGRSSASVYRIHMDNDPRPAPATVPAGRALSGDAAFLSLGQ